MKPKEVEVPPLCTCAYIPFFTIFLCSIIIVLPDAVYWHWLLALVLVPFLCVHVHVRVAMYIVHVGTCAYSLYYL